jgi:hypothetical protein
MEEIKVKEKTNENMCEYILHGREKTKKQTNRINVIRSISFEVEEHQYCKITRIGRTKRDFEHGFRFS